MSRTSSRTFVDACLDGDALLDEIETWVERWHDSGGQPHGTATSLDEYLGFTDDEGRLWAEKPQSLRFIVAAHRAGTSVKTVLGSRSDFALAARASDQDKASEVAAWLKQQDRWNEH